MGKKRKRKLSPNVGEIGERQTAERRCCFGEIFVCAETSHVR